jgi:hypothetical protein
MPAATGPLVKGRYRVSITALLPAGGKPMQDPFEGTVPMPPSIQPMENYIPAKYNAQTILTVTISEDSSKNQLDFALEKGPLPSAPKRGRR